MEPLVKLLASWGPPFLGWVLAGFMMWAYFRLVAKVIDLIQNSIKAHNDVARTLASLESSLSRLR